MTMGNCMSKKNEEDGSLKHPFSFAVLEEEIFTGDLAILKRPGEDIPHYAIFIQRDEFDDAFPLLLVKGKTKPMAIESFNSSVKRHINTVSAASRIFYGDYERVAVRSLWSKTELTCHQTLKLVEEIPEIPFTEAEVAAIQSAKSDSERSSIVCTYMIAHFYKKMGILETDPGAITPQNLEENLALSDPKYIRLPKVKEGPASRGEAPLLGKLV